MTHASFLSREGSTGYGTSSLHQDVKELDQLLDYLFSEPSLQQQQSSNEGSTGKQVIVEDEVVLIGHSTGCQDSVFYMKHGRPDLKKRVKGVVLQAPVSDREWLASLPQTEASFDLWPNGFVSLCIMSKKTAMYIMLAILYR